MSQIVDEFYVMFDFLFDLVKDFTTEIINNDLLRLITVTFFALSAISLVLYILFDFSSQNSKLLQYNTRSQIAENKRMQREMEREQKYNARREQNRIEAEERYKKRKAENKKEREEEWKRRHPNANKKRDLEYADAWFLEHKGSPSFTYNGITYYNNNYLDHLVRKQLYKEKEKQKNKNQTETDDN